MPNENLLFLASGENWYLNEDDYVACALNLGNQPYAQGRYAGERPQVDRLRGIPLVNYVACTLACAGSGNQPYAQGQRPYSP